MMAVRECVLTDFDKALESVKTAYSLCENEKDVTQKITTLLAYSYILYARGDETGTNSKLVELEELMEQSKISPFLITVYVGWKLSQQFAEACGIVINGALSFQNEFSYLNFTRLLIARNELEEAKSILSKIYKQATDSGRVETLLQVEIVHAIINIKQGFEEQAIAGDF